MRVTGRRMSSTVSTPALVAPGHPRLLLGGAGCWQGQSAGSSPRRAGSSSSSGSSGLIRRVSSSKGKMSQPGISSIATGSRPSSSVAAATRAWNSSAVSSVLMGGSQPVGTPAADHQGEGR